MATGVKRGDTVMLVEYPSNNWLLGEVVTVADKDGFCVDIEYGPEGRKQRANGVQYNEDNTVTHTWHFPKDITDAE